VVTYAAARRKTSATVLIPRRALFAPRFIQSGAAFFHGRLMTKISAADEVLRRHKYRYSDEPYLQADDPFERAGHACAYRHGVHSARYPQPNGGMLAVKHCAGNASVRALVLLSAHMGGKNLFRAISRLGLMAGERFEEFSIRARELVAAGAGSELKQVPGWWWVIGAQTFVDYLDDCPDILELAPQDRALTCS
jgi:hypothetical protein